MLNPARFEYFFPVAAYLESPPQQQIADLAAVAAALGERTGQPVPANVAAAVRSAQIGDAHRAIAAALAGSGPRAVWLGALALRHPAYAELRAIAAALAELSGAPLGVLAEGANAAGAYLAGAVPHREPGGKPAARAGRAAVEMLTRPLPAYLLFGGVEPWADAPGLDGAGALAGAEFVAALTPFMSEPLRRHAHLLLPIGTFAETSGTYVNLEGRWQSQSGAAAPVGESRPGWKVLRVLGNLLGLGGFEHLSSEAVREEVRALCEGLEPGAYRGGLEVGSEMRATGPVVDIPMYQVDALVRRAASLQKTREGRARAVSY